MSVQPHVRLVECRDKIKWLRLVLLVVLQQEMYMFGQNGTKVDPGERQDTQHSCVVYSQELRSVEHSYTLLVSVYQVQDNC